MASSITSGQIEGEKVEVVTDFLFLGSKITADGDCSMKSEYSCFLAGTPKGVASNKVISSFQREFNSITS